MDKQIFFKITKKVHNRTKNELILRYGQEDFYDV